mmetsp:Transcript_13066/g.37670  ORF Transcript_13066/g.37670 Transcript_13066/m.37670 type:complete len:216 (+) Transcript_13066:1175-1822(+)
MLVRVNDRHAVHHPDLPLFPRPFRVILLQCRPQTSVLAIGRASPRRLARRRRPRILLGSPVADDRRRGSSRTVLCIFPYPILFLKHRLLATCQDHLLQTTIRGRKFSVRWRWPGPVRRRRRRRVVPEIYEEMRDEMILQSPQNSHSGRESRASEHLLKLLIVIPRHLWDFVLEVVRDLVQNPILRLARDQVERGTLASKPPAAPDAVQVRLVGRD